MNIDNLIKEIQQIDVEKLTDDELLELKQNIIKLNADILKELRKRNIFVNNNLSSAKNEFIDKANVELQRRKPKRNENTTIPDVLRYNGFCEGVWYICNLLNDIEKEQKVFWKSNENEEQNNE
nr:MAG TPA: hypothetical protein [Caudoviricetes sp.]DAX74401.1 MAG TPA: hypothetical protein [Caudoviricetes sp.]